MRGIPDEIEKLASGNVRGGQTPGVTEIAPDFAEWNTRVLFWFVRINELKVRTDGSREACDALVARTSGFPVSKLRRNRPAVASAEPA